MQPFESRKKIAIALIACSVLATHVAEAKKPGPRGWSNPKAFELAKEGIEAKKNGDNRTCVLRDEASLALEEHPYVRIHLASCQAALGELVRALDSAKLALGAGIRDQDDELMQSARKRVEDLLPRIAHVTLKLPQSADGLKVTFDGVPVKAHLLRQRVPVDPGDHVVTAERSARGERSAFRDAFTLKEGDDKVVEVVLKPSSLTEGERECAERATTYEEKLACFERKTTKPNVRVGLDMSGYTDSLDVHVVSPSINAAVSSPTAGWNVGGSYLVDIVTAASPDIVSTASRRFKEQRHAGSVSGGYKIGVVDPQLRANVSSEPDYLSTIGGGSVAIDLAEKTITPRIGYAFSYDRIGIRNTPFSQYERNLSTHEMEGGVSFVLNSTTLLVTGVTVQLERGEQSKLYRFVPMFLPRDAATIRPGESAEQVNALRQDMRAREVLPHTRDRYAVGARINHRTGSATLRVEERVYYDSWDVAASTTDGRYLVDLGERLRVWPHLRFHIQKQASFYRLAYSVLVDDGAPMAVYQYRSGDRELSRMLTVTGGGGARIALGTEQKVKTALIVTGDVMWSRFFQSLYVVSRTAIYGTVGFEVEL